MLTKIVLLCLLALPCLGQIDRDRELAAIASVEGPPPGAAGELTPWHILPSTWADYCALPMKTASLELQRAVALMILDDLEIACWMQGVPVNPYTIALRWNAGPNRRHFEERHYRYAREVQKFYVKNIRKSP